MKKNIILFLILFMLCPNLVNAGGSSDDSSLKSDKENWIECTYDIGSAATFKYYYNTTTNTFTPTANAKVTRLEAKSTLKSSDFINKDTNQLFCPDIYVSVGSNSSGATYTAYSTKKENAVKHSVTKEEKNLLSGESKEEDLKESKVYCIYGNVSFTIDSNNNKILSAEIPNYNITSYEHKIEDLYDTTSKKCKCTKLTANCTTRGGNYCSISKTGSEVCPGDQKELGDGGTTDQKELGDGGTTDGTSNNTTFEFCNDVGILKTFRLVGYAFIIVKILIPLLLIIFGAIDMGKAVVAGDEKAIKNASSMLMTRAIAGVIIFFVPTIIDFAAGLIAEWTNRKTEFENCQTCIFDTDDCSTIITDLEK